jgi:hypothetical protein
MQSRANSSGAYRFDTFLSYATRADYHLVRRLKNLSLLDDYFSQSRSSSR